MPQWPFFWEVRLEPAVYNGGVPGGASVVTDTLNLTERDRNQAPELVRATCLQDFLRSDRSRDSA